MALSQKYLERVRRLSQGKDKPKTVSPQQMARVEQAIQQQQIKYQQEGWRASAKWLEQNCEEFRELASGRTSPTTEQSREPGCETRSLDVCANSELVQQPPRGEPQSPPNAPESSQSVHEALPVSPPIAPLPSLFWHGLLFGSRESIISAADANIAVCLVARQLGTDSDVSEFTDSIRVHTLRQTIAERFGAVAWPAMNELWRSAPPTAAAPALTPDQSQLLPELWSGNRQLPRWIESLRDPSRLEREYLEDLGIGHP
jgi:hypothetical protein